MLLETCAYEWEQRKLKDISTITMGQSPDSKYYSDKNNKFILVQGNADLKNGKVTPRIWTSVAKKIAHSNEILLTVRAPVGKLAWTESDVAIGRGVASINGSKIIYYLLSKLNDDNYWDKFITGSTFESINSDILKDAPANVSSSIKENEKIVKLLEKISNQITFNECNKKSDISKEMPDTIAYIRLNLLNVS